MKNIFVYTSEKNRKFFENEQLFVQNINNNIWQKIMSLKKILYPQINNLLQNNYNLSFTEKLYKIIFYRLNTPYKNNPFKKEDNSPIPFFPVRYSDCVSFVLTSLALSFSNNINEAKYNIIPLHYKKDKVNYNYRYHFTEDRIANNKYFSNISNKIHNHNKILVHLNKKSDNTKLLNIPFQNKIELDYLSTETFVSFLSSNFNNSALLSQNHSINNILNIAFCRFKNISFGHFISHEGFLVNNRFLIHASQNFKKVVKVKITKYLDNYKWDGIILSKISPLVKL